MVAPLGIPATDEAQVALNQVLGEVIRTLPGVPTRLQCRRQRRVGNTYILLALLCVLIAVLPWHRADLIDRVLWLAFSITLFMLGRHQIVKADRDEVRAGELLGGVDRANMPRSRLVQRFRRVKWLSVPGGIIVSNEGGKENAVKAQFAMNEALRHVIQDLPDARIQQRAQHLERQGMTLIVVAGFCLVMAALPWPPGFNILRLMWFGLSLVLLLTGGWQIDKATRDEEAFSPRPRQVGAKRWSVGQVFKKWIRRIER